MLTGLGLLALSLVLLFCVAAAARAPASMAPAPAVPANPATPIVADQPVTPPASQPASLAAAAIESQDPEQRDTPAIEMLPSLVTDDDEDITRLHGIRNLVAEAQAGGDSAERIASAEESADPRPDSHVVVTYEDDADTDEATSPHARILVCASGDSDRGHLRRTNDDSLLIMPECSLFAIADGMGGYAGGQVASGLAVEAVKRAFEEESFIGELRAEKPIPRRGRELASSILQSNWAVFDAARATPALSKMGTTLVAARFSPNKQRVYIGHVGDSRCYRFRGGTLRQLTVDQTMGLIGLQGPRANDLLQAIGSTADLSIDLIVDKPRTDDLYMLCSDGLSKMANDQEVQQILDREQDLEAAVYGLIELANDRGGKDNVSVILIKVIEQPIRAAMPAPGAEMKVKGWTKLPNVAVSPDSGSDDVTVIGTLVVDELKKMGSAPEETEASPQSGKKLRS